MSEKAKQWMAEVSATPEYRAACVTQELIGACEERREKLGLSYAEVARRMGVSRQHVSKLFSGTQNSTIGALVRLALVLDCDLEVSLSPKPNKQSDSKPKRVMLETVSPAKAKGGTPRNPARKEA